MSDTPDRTCGMNTSDPSAHPGQRLNTSDDAAHGFTPDMFEDRTPKQPAPVEGQDFECDCDYCEWRGEKECPRSQPTAQDVMAVLDIPATLLTIEQSLSKMADIAESLSVTLGDKYGKMADSLIDEMERVQALRNQANGIEMDEFDADPA